MGRTLLASLIPSSGFFTTRRKTWGTTMIALLLFPLSYLGYSYYLNRDIKSVAANILSHQSLIYGIVAMAILWVIMWVISIWVTVNYREGGERGSIAPRAIIASLMTILLGGMTILGSYYSLVGIDTLNSVMGGQNNARKTVPQGNLQEPTTSSTEEPTGLLAQDRTNILLIGSDSYPGRPGVRTDSMMLVSIHNQTGNKTMISIPRNLEGYQYREDNPMYNLYPEGKPQCGLECMINTVWEKGDENKNLFPGIKEPGKHNLQQVISDLTNLNIDRTVVVNIRGFSALVDALGGVEMNVPERLPIGGKVVNGQAVGITGWIEPGKQKLNGYQAMWFARSRVLSDDYSRMARQRCMVNALSKQVNPTNVLINFPKIADATKENVTSDLSQSDLRDLATLGERVQKGKSNSVILNTKTISIRHPDYEKIHSMAKEKLDESEGIKKQEPTQSPSPSTSATAKPEPTPTSTETKSDLEKNAQLYAHCAE